LNKEGWTLIRITVEPNGTVTAMNLDGSSGDTPINKAAWGSITGVGQLPPLPKEFTGPNLELRMQFVISHNPAAVD
jgi:TonB family protein